MLLYPPTEGTWLCESEHGEESARKITNGPSQSVCWLCGQKKTAKAEKPYKTYVALCEKVGIEPGWYWKLIDGEPKKKKIGSAVRWADAPVPEGYKL